MSQDLNSRTVAIARLTKGFIDDGMIIPEGQSVYVLFNESAKGGSVLPSDFDNDLMRCVTAIAIDHQGVVSGWVVDIRIHDLKFMYPIRVGDIDLRQVDVRNSIAIEFAGATR